MSDDGFTKVETRSEEEESFVKDLGLDDTVEDDPEPESEGKEEKEEKEEGEESEEEKEEKEEADDEDEDNEEKEEAEEKEEGKEDEEEELTEEEIKKLPKEEQKAARGLLKALQKQRARTKKAEGERDFLKMQKKFSVKPKKEEEKEEDTETEETEIAKLLEGKEDDELLTVGEQKQVVAIQKKYREKRETDKTTKANKANEAHAKAVKEMDDMEDAFKETHPDYDEKFAVFNQALKDMPSLQLEVIAEMKREDGDPIQKVYDLGKKFMGVYGKPEPETKDKKKKKPNKATRILKNAEKKTPSASVPSSTVSDEALDEMDIDELGKTLASMSMAQYMRVPRKIRSKALR